MLILLLLKIAGIVLLSLLGLTLLLILLLLFLPWNYRISGRTADGKYEFEVKVNWMFHAIYLLQSVKSGEEAGGTLRVFGLRLFRSKTEVQEETKKLREERKPDPEVLRQVGANSALFEDPVQNELKSYHSDIPQTSGESGADKGTSVASTGPVSEDLNTKDRISLKTIREMWKNGQAPQPEELVHLLELKLEELIEKAIRFTDEQTKLVVENGKVYLKLLLDNTQESIEKINKLKELVFGQENREPMLLLLKEVRRVLKQVLPRNGEGDLLFGTGDPYYTGKILEVLAVLFPFYGEVIRVCPFFEEKKFEAQGTVCGHFHLIVLAYSFVKVWFNKKLRNIYNAFMRIITDEKSN